MPTPRPISRSISRLNSRLSPRPNAARPAQVQRGTSLIEVLVAILLLSFSLLGIAGLVAATTRNQLGSQTRAMVTQLLDDAASRIRANSTQIPKDAANTANLGYRYTTAWNSQQSAIAAAALDCSTASCTDAARAAYDIWEMRTAARRNLPSGALQVSGDLSNGLTLTYLWMDKDFVQGSPPVLQNSAACTANDTAVQQRICCPVAAAVNTPGVRCLNLVFTP